MCTSSGHRSSRLLAALPLAILASCGGDETPPASEDRETRVDETERRLAALAADQVQHLQSEIDAVIAQLLDENIGRIPMRGQHDVFRMTTLIDRRERIVVRARASVDGRLRALFDRALAIVGNDRRDTAAELVRGTRQAVSPFFAVLDIEQEQIEAMRRIVRLLGDPAQVDWRDGTGRYRTSQAEAQHHELDRRVQELEKGKWEPMSLLQQRLRHAAAPPGR